MPIIISLSVLLFLILSFIIVSAYVCYRITFKRKPTRDPYDRLDSADCNEHTLHSRKLIDRLLSEEGESVYITSRDGLLLAGKYYHRNDGAPLEIMCHGYGSGPYRDMSGGGSEALDRGYNLLLIHHRAHGESEGRAVTFGAKEKYDLLDWIYYCIDRFGADTKIILVGVSMGGATVLLASELDLPKNVRCIIADCPYSSTKKILTKEIAKRNLPTSIFYPIMHLSARLFAGFSPKDASPVDAVTRAKCPILLIHGEDDTFVPTDMSLEIYNACTAEKHRLTIPGAKHGTSYLVDRDRYMNTADAFVDKYINR